MWTRRCATARDFITTPQFRELVSKRLQAQEAQHQYADQPERVAKIISLLLDGERLAFDKSINDYRIVTNCGTMGYGTTVCGTPLSQLSSLTAIQVQGYVDTALSVLTSTSATQLEKDANLRLAYECALAWYVQGGSRTYLEQILAHPAAVSVAQREDWRLHGLAADMLRQGRLDGHIAALNDRNINYGSAFVEAVAMAMADRPEGIKKLEDIGFRWALSHHYYHAGSPDNQKPFLLGIMSDAGRELYLSLPADLRAAIDRGYDLAGKTEIAEFERSKRERFETDPEYRQQTIARLIGEFMTMGVGLGRTSVRPQAPALVRSLNELKLEFDGDVARINPKNIRYSQRSVNDVDAVEQSMRLFGWSGEPVVVIKMPDGRLTTIDNTRVLAASRANIEVMAKVVEFDAPLSAADKARFPPKYGDLLTWGDAVSARIIDQGASYRKANPQGSKFIGVK